MSVLRFGQLLRPCDPSLLAFFRICFGTFMMMDIIQERGLSRADVNFGKDASNYCWFPLIHGMKPYSFETMVILYGLMFISAFFIAIGFVYRVSILSFTAIYWYFFILDASVWNNHSYLYGLISFLLCFLNANNYMSVDGYIFFTQPNVDVPYWNYMLLRFQVFIVYFYAGLKKTEMDWLKGYSMNKLSRKWVFDPFRLLLSDEDINYYIIHIGGFIFDTSVGFLLMFKRTRIIGLVLCANFHGMNAMMFSIGMFPYVMMASSFIFCDPKFFKNAISKFSFWREMPIICKSNKSSCCIYCDDEGSGNQLKSKIKLSQLSVVCLCSLYIGVQVFLPYSHFITKGYNGWTQGLYGYSWDMMVHSFTNQHIKITYKNLDNGEVGYLKNDVFLQKKRSRWTTQPAIAYQYAKCIRYQLRKLGINNSAIYFDVWKSMNQRFQQRIYDPDVDIASYDWSPLKNANFVFPLLSDLSGWRTKLKDIKKQWKNSSSNYRVVFFADFSGLLLENYVSTHITSASFHVLKGQVILQSESTNSRLIAGDQYQITPGQFHTIKTVSKGPSCYYYVYVNKSMSMKAGLQEYENWAKYKENPNGESFANAASDYTSEFEKPYDKEWPLKGSPSKTAPGLPLNNFLKKKIAMVHRSYLVILLAMRNLYYGDTLQNSDPSMNSPSSATKRWDRAKIKSHAVDGHKDEL